MRRIGNVITVETQEGAERIDPLKQHAELMGVIFNEDPTAPLDEEDWPSDLR
jgi:hypothetical protein